MIPILFILCVLWLMASLVLTVWVSHGAEKKRKEREAP